MKQKDLVKTAALKNLLARISAAEAVSVPYKSVNINATIAGASKGVGSTEVPRRNLTILELKALVSDEIDELQQTIGQLERLSEYGASLVAQLETLRDYAE
jgi:hypothetical protein